MNTDERSEDLLRDLLRHKAAEATVDLSLADIQRRAADARRRTRRRTATVVAAAAAAVLVAAVPTAILTSRHDGRPAPTVPSGTPSGTLTGTSTPSPSPSRPTTSPSPTGTATTSLASLQAIPRGADPGIAYLEGGVVHEPDGTTRRLPGTAADVTSFAPYHGGWLVLDDLQTLRQYDSQGRLVDHGGHGSIALSADQLQTAFQIGTTVRLGISTGMGNGEQTWTVPSGATLMGLLSEGAVAVDGSRTTLLTPNGSRSLSLGLFPTTTSEAADLVGGLAGTVAQGTMQGAVADATSGSVLWRGSWRPLRFSADGRYVAAAPVADNGDPSAVAILDARTGHVVATTPDLGTGIYLPWDVAWDGDRLLFDATDHDQRHALLALDLHGGLTRASDLLTAKVGQPAVVFGTQP